MNKRLFTFGCSFTYFFYYPTWADYVGVNFEEFYNLGNPGLSNRTMAERFIEADNRFKFNSDDLVVIATSGITRYNFFLNDTGNQTKVFSHGDLENNASDQNILSIEKLRKHYNVIKFYRDSAWNIKWGVYHTWLALKTMKRILVSNNVPHKIFPGLDTNFHFNKESLDLNEDEIRMSNEIAEMLDIKMSLQEFNDNYPKKHPFNDSHPFIDCHLDYVKTYFPEFVTDRVLEYYENMQKVVERYKDPRELYENLSRFKSHKSIKLYGDYI